MVVVVEAIAVYGALMMCVLLLQEEMRKVIEQQEAEQLLMYVLCLMHTHTHCICSLLALL